MRTNYSSFPIEMLWFGCGGQRREHTGCFGPVSKHTLASHDRDSLTRFALLRLDSSIRYIDSTVDFSVIVDVLTQTNHPLTVYQNSAKELTVSVAVD